MRHRRGALRSLALAGALGLALAACNEDSTVDPSGDSDGTGAPTAVPDFSLADVNATSPTAGEKVSPRDYRGRISAWYFGHAT